MTVQKDYFNIQVDEIETLRSIYDKEFLLINEDDKIFEISLKFDNKSANIQFTLPSEYPDSPPICELGIPWIRGDIKRNIECSVYGVISDNFGCTTIYQIVETVREELQKIDLHFTKENKFEDFKPTLEMIIDESIEIAVFHGEPFVDRKSTFQAHVAIVHSESEVAQVKRQLMKNNKIAVATHNISAFRIKSTSSNDKLLQSCDDDGENKASERLLNMMVLMAVENIFVLVSRWFGGIKLGADRFKHINNTAKDAIIQCGWFPLKHSH